MRDRERQRVIERDRERPKETERDQKRQRETENLNLTDGQRLSFLELLSVLKMSYNPLKWGSKEISQNPDNRMKNSENQEKD